jgi:uridine kinase
VRENLSRLLEIMVSKLHTGARFILGIDGLSRAGKTTLVKDLCRALQEQHIDVCVFHMDDHIVERNRRYNTGHEEWFEYYHLQWDVEWLKENFFSLVRQCNAVILPFYNPDLDAHEVRLVPLPDNGVVIIEGVFLQRQEWRGFFDYVVYLDCARSKRFARESEATQMNIDKFRKRCWPAEDYYIKMVAPMTGADMILRI